MTELRAGSMSFEHFVATTGAMEALELSTDLASGQADGPQLLLLHGPPGVGKSHLLHAVAYAARGRRPPAPVVQTSAMELVQEMIAAMHQDRAARPRRPWAQGAVVTVDDLHVLRGKLATQREVGLLFGAALGREVRLACAAGCSLEEIPALTETLRAAPEARLVEVRRATDDETRRILDAMAKAEGLTLPAKALDSMAARCRGDVRLAASAIAQQRFEASRRGLPPAS